MRVQILALAALLGTATAASAGGSTSTPEQKFEKRQHGYRPVDCHRDIRTHRIGGIKVTHRHVGENCQVRIVRKSTG